MLREVYVVDNIPEKEQDPNNKAKRAKGFEPSRKRVNEKWVSEFGKAGKPKCRKAECPVVSLRFPDISGHSLPSNSPRDHETIITHPPFQWHHGADIRRKQERQEQQQQQQQVQQQQQQQQQQ